MSVSEIRLQVDCILVALCWHAEGCWATLLMVWRMSRHLKFGPKPVNQSHWVKHAWFWFIFLSLKIKIQFFLLRSDHVTDLRDSFLPLLFFKINVTVHILILIHMWIKTEDLLSVYSFLWLILVSELHWWCLSLLMHTLGVSSLTVDWMNSSLPCLEQGVGIISIWVCFTASMLQWMTGQNWNVPHCNNPIKSTP